MRYFTHVFQFVFGPLLKVLNESFVFARYVKFNVEPEVQGHSLH